MNRYPPDWKKIARAVKESANWQCYRCGRECLRPGDTREVQPRRAYMAQVHHWNLDPSDNRTENLVCLCPGCHLSYHRGRRGNISPGQLSLFKSMEL